MNIHETHSHHGVSAILLVALIWIAVMICRYALWMMV